MTLLTVGTESRTQVADIIHDEYLKELQQVFPHYVYIFNKLDNVPAQGDNVIVEAEIGGNVNAKSVAERGALPTPKGRLFKSFTIGPKYTYGTMDITGPELYTKVGPEASKVNLVLTAMKSCWENFIWRCNTIMMLDGSARIAQVNGTPTYDGGTGVTTVTIDNGSIFHLREYQTVRFGTDDTDYTVQSVNRNGLTFTVAGNATTDGADDSWIYHADSYDSGLAVDPVGLKGHCSASNPASGSYQGLSRATTGYEWTQAYSKNQSSVSFTELDFNNFLDNIRFRNGGRHEDIPDLLLWPTGVRNSFQLLLQSRHQNVESVVSKFGFGKVLSYVYAGQNIELVIVDDVPTGTCYAISTPYLKRYTWRDAEWDQSEGNPKLARKSGYDIYEGFIAMYWNLICTNPTKFGIWYNIPENTIS